MNNSLQAKPKTDLATYMTGSAIKQRINTVVGVEQSQRFISAIVSAVTTNEQLQRCTNQSIVSGALLGESLKLSPSPQLGQYYLVPFKDKDRGNVAQFILGYKGYIQLAIRSGYYKKINVVALKEGELIRFDHLTEEIEYSLIDDDAVRENTPTMGYYAMFEYTNGFRKAIYWSKSKMEAHAERYSAGYKAKKGYTLWEQDFDAMAYKTMLRQLISKWGIMSIDMQRAVEGDSAVINADLQPEYADNSIVDDGIIGQSDIKEQKNNAEDMAKAIFG